MNIDDPGILEPRQWEVILAGARYSFRGFDITELPIVDASLGLSTNSQISFAIPYVFERINGQNDREGLGFATLGYKWRFYQTPSSEWAIAPAVSKLITHSLIGSNTDDDINIVSLPLLFSRAVGNWTLLGQVAWFRDSAGNSAWDYGVAAAHPFGNSSQWMIEFYGTADHALEKRNHSLHLGIDTEIAEDIHLLAAVGTQLSRSSDDVDKLRYRLYLGVQWFF